MASVIRVKRKRGEDNLDALKILCKKRRTNGEEAAALETETAIFTFAGTVEDKHNEAVVNRIQSTKEELQSQYKKHTVDIVKKVKEQTKQKSCQNRYKVVNSLRQLDKTGDEESEFNIVDIEDVNAYSDDSNVNYEYDLYYTNDADLVMDDATIVLQEILFDYGEINSDQEFVYDDDDNSNSESNWKNDYGENPDGESDGELDGISDKESYVDNSEEEEGLEKMVDCMKIHDDSSSSWSDNDSIYGTDDEDDGGLFAQFKKKYCRSSSYCSDSSSNSEKESSDCDAAFAGGRVKKDTSTGGKLAPSIFARNQKFEVPLKLDAICWRLNLNNCKKLKIDKMAEILLYDELLFGVAMCYTDALR
ncbi:probable RNA polymerase II nuclear localization protein SLC7A6OS [Trichogramma pretiosum]|uniref:probable RNA polymerase II nuclear localization protein SLC7A6OS n=1 Tax=Trichogramma pretiosum TaxID=7493 RepID=UPI000C71A62E|nr:probable RNA polymerase II nuclear localization protein SLC7A6OS [Trichogramma pretiosum]